MTKQWKKFLQSELNKQADEIEKEVLNDDSLKDVKATPEMHEALMEKIRQADAQKAADEEERYRFLTAEEKEYLRIGRELKQRGMKTVYIFKKKKRMAFMSIAIMAVLVVGMGVTSVGGPQYVLDWISQTTGDDQITQADTNNNDNNMFIKSGANDEIEAYYKVKQKLGFEMVRLDFLPTNMVFKNVLIDEGVNKVDMLYENEGKSLLYQAITSYTESGHAISQEDIKLQEYELLITGVRINVQKYEINESHEILMRAQFEFQNIQYFMSGVIEQEEFEEILNNLHFFIN